MYLHIYLDNHSYQLHFSDRKPQARGSARETLLAIEHILNNSLPQAAPTEEAPLFGMTQEQKKEFWVAQAQTIHDGYYQKRAETCWLARLIGWAIEYFCPPSDPVEAINQRIADTQAAPGAAYIIPKYSQLDPELAHIAFKDLSHEELVVLRGTSKWGAAAVNQYWLNRARSYGYLGESPLEALEYFTRLCREFPNALKRAFSDACKQQYNLPMELYTTWQMELYGHPDPEKLVSKYLELIRDLPQEHRDLQTALFHAALDYDSTYLLQFLLSSCADPNSLDPVHGRIHAYRLLIAWGWRIYPKLLFEGYDTHFAQLIHLAFGVQTFLPLPVIPLASREVFSQRAQDAFEREKVALRSTQAWQNHDFDTDWLIRARELGLETEDAAEAKEFLARCIETLETFLLDMHFEQPIPCMHHCLQAAPPAFARAEQNLFTQKVTTAVAAGMRSDQSYPFGTVPAAAEIGSRFRYRPEAAG